VGPSGGAPSATLASCRGDGSGTVDVLRNVIQSNMSGDDGGGIFVADSFNQRVNIVNNFINNNGAADIGGAIMLDDAVGHEFVSHYYPGPLEATVSRAVSPQIAVTNRLSAPGYRELEEVGRKDRVLFVNDSKATNADSAAQALACFSDIFWIAGGKAKTGGIASLARFFPRMRKAYLIGEAATDFAAELQGRVPHVVAGTLERAVDLAGADAEASDVAEPVVLLSPACASFDQYRNFEVRGDKFRELVRALPGLMPSA